MGILCFGAVGIGPGIPDFLMFSQVRGLSFLIRLAAAAACRRHDCATLKRKVRTKTDNGCGARFEGFRARLARGVPRLRPPGWNTRSGLHPTAVNNGPGTATNVVITTRSAPRTGAEDRAPRRCCGYTALAPAAPALAAPTTSSWTALRSTWPTVIMTSTAQEIL